MKTSKFITIIAITLIIMGVITLTSCSSQRDGCRSTWGKVGYGNR
jgi:hypothetical protein